MTDPLGRSPPAMMQMGRGTCEGHTATDGPGAWSKFIEYKSTVFQYSSPKPETKLTEKRTAERTHTGFSPLFSAEDNESSYSYPSITSKPGYQEYPEPIKEYGERRGWEWSPEDGDYVVKGQGKRMVQGYSQRKRRTNTG